MRTASLAIAISAEGGSDLDFTGRLDLSTGVEVVEIARSLGFRAEMVDVGRTLDHSTFARFDAALLCLHGRAGGRGDVQAILQRLGLPFNGPSAASVALAFDKVQSRQLLAYHNLPVPAAVALGPRAPDQRALELLGWPCYAKPRRGSLGVGVTRIERVDQVADAIDAAMAVDPQLVLERAIEGVEIQIVVHDDRVVGLAEVERDEDGDIISIEIPPAMSRARIDGLHHLARRAVTALGVDEGWSRVDVLINPRDNEAILEVEPLPPLHRRGVVACVAAAAGISHEAIIADNCARLLRQVDQPQSAALFQ